MRGKTNDHNSEGDQPMATTSLVPSEEKEPTDQRGSTCSLGVHRQTRRLVLDSLMDVARTKVRFLIRVGCAL